MRAIDISAVYYQWKHELHEGLTSQRFGQYLMNALPEFSKVKDSALFYEENAEQAFEYAIKTYA